MSYNSNIPQPGNKLKVSQRDLLANFQAIMQLIDVNHVDFANATNQGKHNILTIPLVSTSPAAPAFLSGEQGIYNLVNATTTKNELYVHKQINAGTADIPFTASSLSNTAPVSLGKGWTYMPSGILLVWDTVDSSATFVTPQATVGCPAFNVVFQVQLTVKSGIQSNATVVLSSTPAGTTGNFTFLTNNATGAFVQYLMIGY